ncbi:hypothetical protein JV197_13750, partial [Vibrio furnissii]
PSVDNSVYRIYPPVIKARIKLSFVFLITCFYLIFTKIDHSYHDPFAIMHCGKDTRCPFTQPEILIPTRCCRFAQIRIESWTFYRAGSLRGG